MIPLESLRTILAAYDQDDVGDYRFNEGGLFVVMPARLKLGVCGQRSALQRSR